MASYEDQFQNSIYPMSGTHMARRLQLGVPKLNARSGPMSGMWSSLRTPVPAAGTIRPADPPAKPPRLRPPLAANPIGNPSTIGGKMPVFPPGPLAGLPPGKMGKPANKPAFSADLASIGPLALGAPPAVRPPVVGMTGTSQAAGANALADTIRDTPPAPPSPMNNSLNVTRQAASDLLQGRGRGGNADLYTSGPAPVSPGVDEELMRELQSRQRTPMQGGMPDLPDGFMYGNQVARQPARQVRDVVTAGPTVDIGMNKALTRSASGAQTTLADADSMTLPDGRRVIETPGVGLRTAATSGRHEEGTTTQSNRSRIRDRLAGQMNTDGQDRLRLFDEYQERLRGRREEALALRREANALRGGQQEVDPLLYNDYATGYQGTQRRFAGPSMGLAQAAGAVRSQRSRDAAMADQLQRAYEAKDLETYMGLNEVNPKIAQAYALKQGMGQEFSSPMRTDDEIAAQMQNTMQAHDLVENNPEAVSTFIRSLASLPPSERQAAIAGSGYTPEMLRTAMDNMENPPPTLMGTIGGMFNTAMRANVGAAAEALNRGVGFEPGRGVAGSMARDKYDTVVGGVGAGINMLTGPGYEEERKRQMRLRQSNSILDQLN